MASDFWDYAIHFSRTLDIAYLDAPKYELLRRVDSQNARFTKRMIYFSLNYAVPVRQFESRRDLLRGLGKKHVDSPVPDKIAPFRGLFRGREEIYARRFESRKSGKSGYAPACGNEWVRGGSEQPRIKLDLLCAEARLAIDLDGAQYLADAEA